MLCLRLGNYAEPLDSNQIIENKQWYIMQEMLANKLKSSPENHLLLLGYVIKEVDKEWKSKAII